MTRITSLFDCGSTWLLFIPAAWLLVKFTAFTLPVVYLLVNCLELVKAGIGIVLSAKGVWVNNIISVGANKT
jgi:Na+-driven multidrug efflux pump